MRYFYTDALAAAYMAKHHGMKLLSRHTDEQMDGYEIPEHDRFFDWFDSCIVDGWERDIEMVSEAVGWIEEASDKIYIHPDSVALLEPQTGDVAEHNGVEFGIVIGFDKKEVGLQYCEDSQGGTIHGMAAIDEITIIQRNGKAFMWPETETKGE